MGIIKRQGIKQGLVSYIGAAIGIVSTFYVYTLDQTFTGELQFLLNFSAFLVPIFLLGFNALVVKFFPEFKDQASGHRGFLGFLLLGGILSFLLIAIISGVFADPFLGLLEKGDFDTSKIIENYGVLLGLCFLLILITIQSDYISNFHRIVVPNILTNLSLKIILPALVLAFYYHFLDNSTIKWLLLIVHGLIYIGLVVYTIHLKQWHLKIDRRFLTKPLIKNMMNYALFGILGSIGSVLVFRIDYMMVSMLSVGGYFSTGIYHFAINISNVIAIPFTSFKKIAGPIIADGINQEDKSPILDIYQRSSLNLLIVGLGLFLATWISIDELFLITPKPEELIPVKYVVLLLGSAKLVDMVTGINDQIIAYSKFYRFNVFAILLLGIVNIGSNLWLIPRYDIEGAAMATFLALFLFNLAKFLFVWIKFKMQPFTFSELKVLLLAAIAYGLAYLIPVTSSVLLDIVIHSGTFSCLFAAGILYFKVAPDLTKFFNEILNRIRAFF